MFGALRKRFSGTKGRKQVFVLGIDGVPHSLLERFIGEGLMPNLAGLLKKGTFTSMTASIPEVSSTSWSTFMTGVNPGRHGIYGFTELRKDSYTWRFPNFDDIKSDTLWHIAGNSNKTSIVLNVPSTYPARSLNGVLASGFVAIDLEKATYPRSAYEYLSSIGYRIDVDMQKARESSGALAEDIENTFRIRKKAILHYLDSHEWDLFLGVITETDRLHHYLWNALHEKSHPQHDFFRKFYREVDGFIAELYERVGDDRPFLIISDHGFTTIKKEVYLNSWLRENGYLSFRTDTPETFEDMRDESTVFVLDPARFYVHMEGKYPRGSVNASEYEGIRQKLRDDLLSLSIDGEKVIKQVMYKEEIYSGSFLDDAPDVVALPHDGYDLKGAINKPHVHGSGFLTGGHTRENATFYINRPVVSDDINIVDVGPTIISLLGIDRDSFDGRCLLDK